MVKLDDEVFIDDQVRSKGLAEMFVVLYGIGDRSLNLRPVLELSRFSRIRQDCSLKKVAVIIDPLSPSKQFENQAKTNTV